jgi:hypothetical protein
MMNLSPCSPIALDTPLTLVKFLVPLENDAPALPATLGLIDTICHRGALAHEIVAVDDASRDDTAAVARRYTHFMPLWLIQHGNPLGRAAAFRTALEAACRDAAEEDLLVAIDPRCRPDPASVLGAVTAARSGWRAVLAPAGLSIWSEMRRPNTGTVAVYQAGLIRRNLSGFRETQPRGDEQPASELERYLASRGVSFLRLPPPQPRPAAPRTIDLPVPASHLGGRIA